MATSGWLNSKRQQLKFYKDIYYHYLKNRFIRGGQMYIQIKMEKSLRFYTMRGLVEEKNQI